MKVLLLTDLPPCDDYTAGLVLSAMARFVPAESLCCFTVVNPTIPVKMSPEFSGMPVEFHRKPNENWAWIPRRRLFNWATEAFVNVSERLTHKFEVEPLIEKAVAFGRAQGVDRVWAVLEGQTMIRMAEPVAARLGVPLHTHVWDPFSWWAKANRLDPRTAANVQSRFDRAVRASKAVATASQPMADLYRQCFNVDAVPVIASHADSLAKTPPKRISADGMLLIGMAGQFYSATEWLSLLESMRAANWRVAGRDLRIVVMGPQVPPQMDEGRIIFLGWKTQAQAAGILSNCDFLYCPYPFDPTMKEVSQFSFPSKLVLYLAAGRPIVFHGPDYSAPALYIRNNGCGLVADQLFPTAVFNAIERLTVSPELYEASAAGAQRAFVRDFTLQSMQRAFSAFLDLDAPQDSVRTYDHRAVGSNGHENQLREKVKNRSFPVVALKYGRIVRDHWRAVRRRLYRIPVSIALAIPRVRALKAEVHALYSEVANLQLQLADLRGQLAQSAQPASSMPFFEGRAFFRGHCPLVFGRSDLMARLPAQRGLEGHLSNALNKEVMVRFNLRDNTASFVSSGEAPSHTTANADFAADNADGKLACLIRAALHGQVDELVVVGKDLADLNVRIGLHVGDLLKIPVNVATVVSGGLPGASDDVIFTKLTSSDVSDGADAPIIH